MFADVSGFTKLSEAMARHGPEGAEYLTRHLNSYFSQVSSFPLAERARTDWNPRVFSALSLRIVFRELVRFRFGCCRRPI